MTRYILWVDAETTGKEARSNYILEIAGVITDLELFEVEHYTAVIDNSKGRDRGNLDLELMLSLCDPVVLQMHTKNGLFEELENDKGVGLWEAQSALVNLVKKYDTFNGPCGGSTPQFDRSFMKEHMPVLDGLFNHRVLDVSSFGWWQEMHGMEFPREEKPHRALPDIRHSIGKLRFMRGKPIL